MIKKLPGALAAEDGAGRWFACQRTAATPASIASTSLGTVAAGVGILPFGTLEYPMVEGD